MNSIATLTSEEVVADPAAAAQKIVDILAAEDYALVYSYVYCDPKSRTVCAIGALQMLMAHELIHIPEDDPLAYAHQYIDFGCDPGIHMLLGSIEGGFEIGSSYYPDDEKRVPYRDFGVALREHAVSQTMFFDGVEF